jgi:hypothetical protein
MKAGDSWFGSQTVLTLPELRPCESARGRSLTTFSLEKLGS